MPQVELNAPAPNFELADMHGQHFQLAAQVGQPLLLVFNRGFT